MWIVKIGGSWLKNPKLPVLINSLQKFSKQKIVLVVGGGVFAETVRSVYTSIKMKQETGHILAMKATEIFAYYLKSINPNISITFKISNFFVKKLNLWLPTEILSYEAKFEKHKKWFSQFTQIVRGDDPELKEGKPAPDIFLLAAKRLRVDPAECLVFEDAPTGTEAALAAGMSVVVVPDPNMDHCHYKKASQIISSLKDFDPEYWGLPKFDESI